MKNGKRPLIPPWMHDSHPENWTDIALAARVFFHKSIVTVKRYIKSGYLDEVGIPSWWDGKRWHVRLPMAICRVRRNRKAQSERASA